MLWPTPVPMLSRADRSTVALLRLTGRAERAVAAVRADDDLRRRDPNPGAPDVDRTGRESREGHGNDDQPHDPGPPQHSKRATGTANSGSASRDTLSGLRNAYSTSRRLVVRVWPLHKPINRSHAPI